MDELSKRLLDHEPISFKTGGGDRQGAEELQARRARPGDLLRRRGRRRHPAASTNTCARAWRTRRPAHRLRDPRAAAARGAGRDGAGRASRSTPTACATSPTTSRCAWASWRPEAHASPAGRSTWAAPSRSATCCSARWACSGGKKTATGAWSTDVGVLEDLAAQGHDLPRILLDWRQLSKLKGTYTDNLVAAIVRAHRTGSTPPIALAATTTGRLSSSDPNLQNIPIRTEEGRKIRAAFIAEPGPSADQRRLQPDRAAPAGPHRRHRAAQARLPGRPRHPRHDRLGDVRRAGRGHAGRDAPPRQGDQLRHRLRHLRLRPRQPARRSRRTRPGPTSRPTSSASPASAPTWTRRAPRCGRRASSPPCSAARSTSR